MTYRNIQSKYQSSGFTLIELMIVMSIVALLMALVGPLTIKSYQKIKAKEELSSLQNWIKINSYRSFVIGQPGIFTLQGNSIIYRVENWQHTENAPIADENVNTIEPIEAQPYIQKTFKFIHLKFPTQTINVNVFGLIYPTQVNIEQNDKLLQIDLSEKVNGNKK